VGAGHEGEQRRLAGAGRPDEHDVAAGGDLQLDGLECRRPSVEALGDAVRGDVPRDVDQRARVGRRPNARHLVEDLEDPLGRCRGPLGRPQLPTERRQGREHHRDVAAEGDELVQFQPSVDDRPPAEEEEAGPGEVGQVLDGRVVPGGRAGHGAGHVQPRARPGVELVDHPVGRPEDVEGQGPAQGLLGHAGDLGLQDLAATHLGGHDRGVAHDEPDDDRYRPDHGQGEQWSGERDRQAGEHEGDPVVDDLRQREREEVP
jgi:hypothetical protein